MFYEPHLGHGLPHDPFKAIIAPRPIGWISTLDTRGRPNLAPYSFFNAVHSRPPMLAFTSESMKHSAANAIATGEFVFNLATRPLFEAMNISSGTLAEGESEFAAAGADPGAGPGGESAACGRGAGRARMPGGAFHAFPRHQRRGAGGLDDHRPGGRRAY